MATTIDTATVTGADVATEAPPIKRSGRSHVSLNLNTNGFSTLQPLAPIRTRMKKKYRHVAAVHSTPRASCLSHDSEIAPSFLGFRNLMVIVLSKYTREQSISSGWVAILTSANSCWEPAFDDREL